MEIKSYANLSLLTIILSLFLLPGNALSPPGTIERNIKDQVLASLPPSHETTPTYGSSHLFLTSPSKKYSAFLARRETAIGGSGNDFCYIRIEETIAQSSVWESQCTSVSNLNTCTLVFSYAGLEIFDGNHLAWDTGADDDHLQSLDLLDGGDMEIRDKDGKLVWKASDNPLVVNQNCGYNEASIAKVEPPFEGSLGNQGLGYPQQIINHPFSSSNQQYFSSNNQPLSGSTKPFGSSNYQPFGASNQQGLVNKPPFESGVLGKKTSSVGVNLIALLNLTVAFLSIV